MYNIANYLALLGLVLLVSVNCASFQLTEAQQLIEQIPVADRPKFLAYHLELEARAQGRRDVTITPSLKDFDFEEAFRQLTLKFKDLPVPTAFGRNLLTWAERQARPSLDLRSDDNGDGLLICFPSGCVDPDDIGTICCPF